MGVLAYHIVCTTYGVWLPNDPRGSWSQKVYARGLRELGEPVSRGRNPEPPCRRLLFDFKRKGARLLKHPIVRFDETTRRIVGGSIGETSRRLGYTVHSLSVMPDHMHIVIERHRHRIAYIANQLKAGATLALRANGWERKRPVWTRGYWVVFLWDADTVQAAIGYVSENPMRDGLAPQLWHFIVPFTHK